MKGIGTVKKQIAYMVFWSRGFWDRSAFGRAWIFRYVSFRLPCFAGWRLHGVNDFMMIESEVWLSERIRR
jgi:hypothetical protein